MEGNLLGNLFNNNISKGNTVIKIHSEELLSGVYLIKVKLIIAYLLIMF